MAVVRSPASLRSASTRSKACAGVARHCRKASRDSVTGISRNVTSLTTPSVPSLPMNRSTHVAAGREAVADRVLGVRLGNGRQVRGAAVVAVHHRDRVAVGAVDAAASCRVRPEASSTVRPTDPVARGAEAEGARAGGIGRHHAAHRGAGLGRVERQREAGCRRGEPGLQLAQAWCRRGRAPSGGCACRSSSTMPRRRATDTRWVDGSGTAPPATPVRAPLTVTACPCAACQRSTLPQFRRRCPARPPTPRRRRRAAIRRAAGRRRRPGAGASRTHAGAAVTGPVEIARFEDGRPRQYRIRVRMLIGSAAMRACTSSDSSRFTSITR